MIDATLPLSWAPYLQSLQKAKASHAAFEKDRLEFLAQLVILQRHLQSDSGRPELKLLGIRYSPSVKAEEILQALLFPYTEEPEICLSLLTSQLVAETRNAKSLSAIKLALEKDVEFGPDTEVSYFPLWGLHASAR